MLCLKIINKAHHTVTGNCINFYHAHAFCAFAPIQMQTGYQSLDPSRNVPLVEHICTWTVVAVILRVEVVVISHYNNAVVISRYSC